MFLANAFDQPQASWNLVQDAQTVLQFAYMRHAVLSGMIVAVLAAVVGWFTVLRAQTYAGHTLSVAAFPGAAGATLLGLSPLVGFFGFCGLAALGLAFLDRDGDGNGGKQTGSATVASVQAFALALGLLFAGLYHGVLTTATSFLFGTFTGIGIYDLVVLVVVASVSLVALGIIGRPLLFASIDADVARAVGIPVRGLSVIFLLILGLSVAEVSRFTGALLVFALLVAPAATAQHVTARPGLGMCLAATVGVMVTWAGLGAAYFTNQPAGFFITTLAFIVFVVVHPVMWVCNRNRNRNRNCK